MDDTKAQLIITKNKEKKGKEKKTGVYVLGVHRSWFEYFADLVKPLRGGKSIPPMLLYSVNEQHAVKSVINDY